MLLKESKLDFHFTVFDKLTMTSIGSRAVKLARTVYQSPCKGTIINGLPLVMAHGMFGNQRSFDSAAQMLSQRGRKVITADMRNHGESVHADRMDFTVMSEDLSELLKEEKAEGGVVLGHSMGGKAAMVLALTQPDKVSNLIIEDVAPTCLYTSLSPIFRPLLSVMKAIDFSTVSTLSEAQALARQQLQQTMPDNSVCEFLVQNVVRKNEVYRWRINVEAIDDHLEDLLNFPEVEGTFTGKTLFIKGGNSDVLGEVDMPEIRRLFPNSHMETVAEAGHMIHAEKCKEFVDIVSSFLDDK